MPKTTDYTQLTNLRSEFLFNEPEFVIVGEETITKYRPLTIKVYGQALTSDSGKKDLQAQTTVGQLQDNPMTAKQIYNALGLATNLHTRLQNALKQLYLDAISEDVSV